jgi:hypothetical protein
VKNKNKNSHKGNQKISIVNAEAIALKAMEIFNFNSECRK